jgi:hypothetical protein
MVTPVKFKKGDRVVSTVSGREYYPPIGTLGTVNQNNSYFPRVIWDEPYAIEPGRGGRDWGVGGWRVIYQDDLKLVSTKTILSTENIFENTPKTTPKVAQESISKKYRFKKGDRVVSIVNYNRDWPPMDTLGTIDENNSPMPCIIWDEPYNVIPTIAVTWNEPYRIRVVRGYGRGWGWMHENDLELVETTPSVPRESPDEAKIPEAIAPCRRMIEL